MRSFNYKVLYDRMEEGDGMFCEEKIVDELLIIAQEHLHTNKAFVIAIDGRSAAGKTTFASKLQKELDADVIHMDDFFVPFDLRSEERFKTPGMNIHHERFAEEVLPFISTREQFDYRIFDCGMMDYNGSRTINNSPFRIVEGAYSCHPIFGEYADMTIFLDIAEDEQKERIRIRNGEDKLKMFLNRWIPMEEEYFNHYNIRENVDKIILNQEKREK